MANIEGGIPEADYGPRRTGTPQSTTPVAEQILFAALKGGLGKRARDELGRVEAQVIAKTAGTPSGIPYITEALCRDGLYVLSSWDGPAAVIRAALEPLPTTRSDNRFDHYATSDLLRLPIIASFVTDERLIQSASGYLGASATISVVTAWWSHPTVEAPVGMQQWHHDRGDFRSVNFFMYLTDVDGDSGPHCFVPGTHESGPRHLERESWFDQSNRKTDADVARHYGAHHTFTGPAGTAFFEDTRGLHKGEVPKTKPRLMFEIVYTLLPKMNEVYAPVECPLKIDIPLVKYATRLMYR